MIKLNSYMQDGANCQAKAVLAYLQGHGNIEESWDKEFKKYDAYIKINRWENCREQGYIVSLRSKDFSRQLNIAFFEHRNSDSIHAIKWEQLSMNLITIENADFQDIYKDKYDTSYCVEYGEVVKMSNWIWNELSEFWIKTSKI